MDLGQFHPTSRTSHVRVTYESRTSSRTSPARTPVVLPSYSRAIHMRLTYDSRTSCAPNGHPTDTQRTSGGHKTDIQRKNRFLVGFQLDLGQFHPTSRTSHVRVTYESRKSRTSHVRVPLVLPLVLPSYSRRTPVGTHVRSNPL